MYDTRWRIAGIDSPPHSVTNCEFEGETFEGPITIDDMRTVEFDNATVGFTCFVD